MTDSEVARILELRDDERLPEDYPGYCLLCGTNRAELHHVIARSQAPSLKHSPENQVPLCRSCHNRIHDFTWTLQRVDGGLALLDREGETISEILAPPPGHAPQELMELLATRCEETDYITDCIKYLRHQDVEPVWELLNTQEKVLPVYKAALIAKAWTLMPHLTEGEKVQALEEKIGLKKSQLYLYRDIWKSFSATPEFQQGSLGLRYYEEALHSAAPPEWIRHAQEQKVHNPHYTSSDLRQEIIEAEGQAPHYRCPGCGFEGLPRWSKVAQCVQCGHGAPGKEFVNR